MELLYAWILFEIDILVFDDNTEEKNDLVWHWWVSGCFTEPRVVEQLRFALAVQHVSWKFHSLVFTRRFNYRSLESQRHWVQPMAGLILGAGLKFNRTPLNFSPASRIRPAIGCNQEGRPTDSNKSKTSLLLSHCKTGTMATAITRGTSTATVPPNRPNPCRVRRISGLPIEIR